MKSQVEKKMCTILSNDIELKIYEYYHHLQLKESLEKINIIKNSVCYKNLLNDYSNFFLKKKMCLYLKQSKFYIYFILYVFLFVLLN